MTWLIAILCLSFGGVNMAQAEEPSDARAMFRFGGLVGGGLVDWVGKDADPSRLGEIASIKAGLSAGVVAALDGNQVLALGIEPISLALQLEFVYATKGTQIERNGEDARSFHLGYLQTGLHIRAEYATAGRVHPYLLLGPELGFLHKAEVRSRSGDTTNIEDDFKTTDLGLVLGLGAMYALPPWGSLGLELRADLGLVSIDGQGDGDEIRNAALSLLLVYLY